MRRRARMIIPGTARRPWSPRSTSRVLGQCSRRHRYQEFVRFLDKIDRDTPAPLEVHLITDNDAPHKHAAVRRWLERHPRFHIHFTPTSASWLNMVERLFADLTCRRLRRGCFRSVAELKSAIRRYLNDRNAAPTTATPLPNRSFGPKGPTPSFENTNGLNGTLFRRRFI